MEFEISNFRFQTLAMTEYNNQGLRRVFAERDVCMGRIIKEIEIEGQSAVALFDTGAIYTYVREGLLARRRGTPSPGP